MEQKTFNHIFTLIKDEFSEATVLDAFPDTEPSFPCVIFNYAGETTDESTVDTSGENYTMENISVDVFTNGSDRVTLANSMQKRVDDILCKGLRMSRTTQERTSDFLNRQLHRIRTTYTFKIDANEKINE